MDHARGFPRHQCHVQSVKHQLRGERGTHRPANDAATVRIEHDSEIEKARPCRNIGDIGDPQPIRRFRREIALDQVWCLTAVALESGDDELAATHTGKTGLRHQPRDAFAANLNAVGRKLGMDAWRTVGTVRGSVRHTDLRDQCSVCLCPPRWPPLRPRVVAARGDTQQPAHGDDRVTRLVIAHEPESFGGIVFVSRANQAAAFERISRSSRS